MWQQDLSAACENMLLEACNLDLGGLWNGVAPDIERMKRISEIIELPDNLKVFGIVTLGYPGDGQETSLWINLILQEFILRNIKFLLFF